MERISAFMDGEVEDHEANAQLGRLKQEQSSRQTWDTYHLIGDAMRGDAGMSPGFMGRFSAALAQEPIVLAPRPSAPKQNGRRLALSIAASFGGVALVAWLAFSNNPMMPGAEVKTADNSPATVQPVAAQGAVKSANGAVNDYLLAHQQFSPSTAMQGVASYVRTVSGREADMR